MGFMNPGRLRIQPSPKSYTNRQFEPLSVGWNSGHNALNHEHILGRPGEGGREGGRERDGGIDPTQILPNYIMWVIPTWTPERRGNMAPNPQMWSKKGNILYTLGAQVLIRG